MKMLHDASCIVIGGAGGMGIAICRQLLVNKIIFGMIYSTMLGIDFMKRKTRSNRTGAIILNIASIVGLDPLHLLPVYSASKHAIVGFSRAYSHESLYAVSGVKIIILCPGATITSFATQFSGNMIVHDEDRALDFFRSAPKQRSELLAEHVVHLIQSAKNGSVWISDNGQLTEVKMNTYCSPAGPDSQ